MATISQGLAAELTADPGRREEYLKLAREWTEAATALQALTRSNRAARLRLAYVPTKKTTQTLDPQRSQETYEDLEKLREARAR